MTADTCTDRFPDAGGSRLPAALYVSTLLIYTSSAVTTFALPLRAHDLDMPLPVIGLVVGSKLLASAPLALPLGLLGDALGHRRLLLFSVALIGLSTALMSFFTSLFPLLVATVINGAGNAGVFPCLNATLVRITGERQRVMALSYLSLATNLGLTLGPAVAGSLLEAIGYRAVFLVSAVIATVSVAPLCASVPADVGARRLRTAFDRIRAACVAVGTDRRMWTSWVAALAFHLMWGTHQNLLPVVARAHGFATAHLGWIFGLQSGVNTLSRVPVGRLIKRLGPRLSLICGAVLAYACYLAVVPSITNLAVLGAAMACSALFVAFATLAIQVRIARTAEASAIGAAMGGYSTAFYLGFGVGPVVSGAVAGSLSHQAGFRVIAAIALLLAMTVLIVEAAIRSPRTPPHRPAGASSD